MRVNLIADEGYIYTDGENYGRIILLENGRSAEDFYQISIEEYENKMIEMEGEINE